MAETVPPSVAAHVPNLFDRSRFRGLAIFVDSPDEVQSLDVDLLLVDLDRCEDVAAYRLDGVRVVGFGPHADTELHRQAAESGYDEILARSVFFTRLPSLLAGTARE